MGGSRGGGGRVVAVPLVCVLVIYFLASAASFSTCDMFVSGLLSGGAWHWAFRERTVSQNSCTAARAAAASGGVRHKFLITCGESEAKSTILGQSKHQKITIFRAPLLRNKDVGWQGLNPLTDSRQGTLYTETSILRIKRPSRVKIRPTTDIFAAKLPPPAV